MKKKATRFMALAGMLVVLALALAGCSKTTTCAICGNTAKCTQEKYLGVKVWVCDSCAGSLSSLGF